MARPFFILAAALTAFAVAACGRADPEPKAACAPAAGDSIAVTDAWLRPAKGRPVTAAYFSLCNAGETDDALVAVESDIAGAVELHESRMSEDGVASMAPIGETPLPAGATARFEPGGAHAMMIGLNRDIETGDHVRLILRFKHAGPIEVEAEARP